MTTDTAADCPECSRPLPEDRRYAIWCRHCGWNLEPAPAPHEPAWQLERERKLADSLAERPASGPERSLSAFLLSLPVLLIPLPGLLGGIALLVLYRPIWFAAPFAVVLFVITAIFRPRTNRLPSSAQAVTRAHAPQLYDVLDRLAGQTATPKLAAAVTPAAALERALLAEICYRALERAVRLGRAADPLDALRRTAAEIPEHEFARLVRVDRAGNGRSDADHPPTWQRTRLLRAHPTPTTSVFAPDKDDELRAAARAAVASLHD